MRCLYPAVPSAKSVVKKNPSLPAAPLLLSTSPATPPAPQVKSLPSLQLPSFFPSTFASPALAPLSTLAALLLSLQAPATPPPEPLHKATFRGLSWDSVITDLNIYHGAKVIPIALYPNGRSGFYDYLGPDPMLFFREVTGTDGKTVPQLSGSVPLSDFKERTLLIFFSKPGDPKQYLVTSVDDSDAAIPPGGYCFINLSKANLQVKCGASQGKVAAGQSNTLRGNPADNGGITALQVDAETPDGKINHVYSNMLPFGKTNRTLVFVSQPPNTNTFEIKRITEDAAMLPKPSPRKKHRTLPSD